MQLRELEVRLAIAQQQEAARVCAANPNCTVVVGAGAGVNVATK